MEWIGNGDVNILAISCLALKLFPFHLNVTRRRLKDMHCSTLPEIAPKHAPNPFFFYPVSVANKLPFPSSSRPVLSSMADTSPGEQLKYACDLVIT